MYLPILYITYAVIPSITAIITNLGNITMTIIMMAKMHTGASGGISTASNKKNANVLIASSIADTPLLEQIR